MGEYYDEWMELLESGETDLAFEDWYSGECADAEDRCDMER